MVAETRGGASSEASFFPSAQDLRSTLFKVLSCSTRDRNQSCRAWEVKPLHRLTSSKNWNFRNLHRSAFSRSKSLRKEIPDRRVIKAYTAPTAAIAATKSPSLPHQGISTMTKESCTTARKMAAK